MVDVTRLCAPNSPDRPPGDGTQGRLQWLDATDDMLAESRAFLLDHGYGGVPHLRGYTSRTRDAERAKRGLPPLKSEALDAPAKAIASTRG